MPASRQIRAVCFDIGETLVDETRHWQAWAEYLGVSALTFFGALGAVIERGEHHQRVFQLIRPGFDLAAERARRGELAFEARDFYPDAVACLKRLRAAGYQVGLVGNQPAAAEAQLAKLGLQADWIASSEGWGVAKPALEFFARVDRKSVV